MRAIIVPQYGPPEVAEMREVPSPTVGPKHVLVRVFATTVTSGDWRVRSGKFPRGFGWIATLAVGMRGPRNPILGTEVSGVVEAVGPQVNGFKVGDAVVGFTGASMGGHAEVCRFLESDGLLMLKPTNLTFEEAASISFGGTTAIDVLRRAKLKAGDRILIVGASGGVGTSLVQLAKHVGAHVTGVCSASNIDFVRSLGADRVIDYAHEDFTKEDARYDVIVDTAGTAPYARSKVALEDGGRLGLVLATLGDNLGALGVGLFTRHKVLAGPVMVRADHMRELAQLAQSGALKPVIGARFEFERIVDAHRLVETGHKRGSVVVKLDARATDR